MKINKPLTWALLFLFPLAAVGETIEVPVGSQAQDKWSIDRPVAGMLKTQVEAIFGSPLSSKGPVGEPPISSWTYADFVVYFEYDHVVHSVLIPASSVTNLQTGRIE